ncbi:MAG TPA: thymidine phosphorylase, partial [Fimbriiglobus sp.]|nr:thymidine phosphorylase [Fimbriiglobus sp.]
AEDAVDRAVGVVVRAKPGERVSAGDTVFEVRYRDARKLADALPLLEVAYRLGDTPTHTPPLVLESIT